MKAEKKLAEVVREKLSGIGISQEEFSTRQCINFDTFRTQLARNVYSAVTLQVIASLLEVSVDDLHQRYFFEKMQFPDAGQISPLDSCRRLIARSIRIKKEGVPDFLSHLRRIYTSLNGTEDLSVLLSLERPLEFGREDDCNLQESILQALRIGATLVYVCPDTHVREQLSKVLFMSKCGFMDWMPLQGYRDLISRLKKAGATTRECSRVVIMEADWCPFWAANTVFHFCTLVSRRQERGSALFARFPYAQQPDLMTYVNRGTTNACAGYLHGLFKGDARLSKLVRFS